MIASDQNGGDIVFVLFVRWEWDFRVINSYYQANSQPLPDGVLHQKRPHVFNGGLAPTVAEEKLKAVYGISWPLHLRINDVTLNHDRIVR